MTWSTQGLARSAAVGLPIIIATVAIGAASADTITIGTSSKDATLIENATTAMGNGKGFAFFAGRVGTQGTGTLRRGLLKFDLQGVIPAGSTINSVSLTLRHVQNNNGTQTVRLHRALADWGEGPSDSPGGQGVEASPGDCTWLHTFYPGSFWSTPGGDFVATASASTTVAAIGFYTWATTPALVADVQAWVDNPQSNFGWLVRGNEAVLRTSKKFASREWALPDQTPHLTINYTPASSLVGDLDGNGVVNGLDLGILLSAWSIPSGAPGCGGASPCPADLDHNGKVDSVDLGMLLVNWTL